MIDEPEGNSIAEPTKGVDLADIKIDPETEAEIRKRRADVMVASSARQHALEAVDHSSMVRRALEEAISPAFKRPYLDAIKP